MKSKLFIFGGFGFIGLNLNEYLSKDFKITLIGNKSNFHHPQNCKKIITNIFSLKNLKKINFRNSYIIVPILYNQISKKNYKHKFKKLIQLLINKKPKKIILLSSASIYGSSNKIVNERSKIKLKSRYAEFCQISEKICIDKKITILRIANLFGPYKKNPTFIEKIIEDILCINKYEFSKQILKRSYLSMSEFSKIIKVILNKQLKNKIYNISNPNNIRDSYSIINFFENKFKIKINKFSKENVTIKNSVISSRLFEKDFRFNFSNKLENDFIKLYYFYKKKFSV